MDDEHGQDDPRSDDDSPLTEYGHAPSPAEQRQIRSLLEHYYAAAATGREATVCSMAYRPLARDPSLRKTIPEDRYSRRVHIRVMPGASCAQVVRSALEEHHRTLALEASTLTVATVRVNGSHGLAILGFATVPEHWMPIARERGAWKLESLLALLLP